MCSINCVYLNAVISVVFVQFHLCKCTMVSLASYVKAGQGLLFDELLISFTLIVY